jgi:hypothetical protein
MKLEKKVSIKGSISKPAPIDIRHSMPQRVQGDSWIVCMRARACARTCGTTYDAMYDGLDERKGGTGKIQEK